MIVYEIKNKINGKSYIGQHCSNELGHYWGSGLLIKKAIKRYGKENFERIILEKCNNKDQLNKQEIYWIKEKNTRINGYNLNNGGTGGDNSEFINYSKEWRKKQSKKIKQYWEKMSDVERKRRSEKVKGENNGMFGKIGYWKNKKLSKETIEKQLNSRRSYKGDKNPNWKGGISKKENAKYRDRNGDKNPFYGKTHTAESRKKISDSKRGKKPTNTRKILIEDNIYEGLNEASIATGIKQTTIWHRINSKNKKYKNYRYYN